MSDADEVQPDFILAGVGKAATTWVYECLADHPGVHLPDTDSLNFFDLAYHRGMGWYTEALAGGQPRAVVGEATPGYLIDPHAARRIATHCPDATLLFCLRNPIDRAFSHWWHGKSDGYWTYDFDEIFDNYPPYQMWVTPGYYDYHLSRFDEYFDEDQRHVLFFDDLVADDAAFISKVFSIVGVDPDYTPAPVGERVNEAHYAGPNLFKRGRNWVQNNASAAVERVLSPGVSLVRELFLDKSAYERGMDPEVRAQLEEIYRTDIHRLEDRTGRDLSHWFQETEP